MPLVSSRESVRRGSPSLLAMVETIAASGISLWFAWKQNSVEHIVIASALAPFLLLRTRLSTKYTIRIIGILGRKTRDNDTYGVIFLMLIPLIKIICSIRTFFKIPLYAISTIPMNFYKNVFLLDMFISPQVIPGMDEVTRKSDPILNMNAYTLVKFVFDEVRAVIKSKETLLVQLFSSILDSILVIPLIIVAFAFRFAIKSTALVWLPLLWIIHQSQPGTRVLDRMDLNVKDPWSKLMLGYSLIVIFLFILKIALIFGIWRFELGLRGQLGVLATRIVAPLELPLWQVTSAINGGLAWAFFFRAKRHLLAKNSTEAWPEAWVAHEYVVFQGVRTTLSLYAIACTFYIAAATAWQTEWPPIRFILFPWTDSPGP